MTAYTRCRSLGAIALGVLCAAGTAYVLFWHVKSLADLTTNHVLIALALVCALGAGHYFWAAIRRWQIISALGFGVLFLAGTGVCAIISAGRGAETLLARHATVDHANGARLNHERMIVEAKAERDAAKVAADAAEADAKVKAITAAEACKVGRLCKANTLTATNAADKSTILFKRYEGADARYWQLVAQLANHRPQLPANVELRNFAKIWALITGVDESRSNEAVELLWPFLLSFLTEMGTIVFLNYGFGHETVPARPRTEPKAQFPTEFPEKMAATAHQEVDPEWVRGVVAKSPSRRVPVSDQEAVVTALARIGRPASNDELAAAMAVSKGESSKRVSSLNGVLDKRRNGRYLAIRLREQQPAGNS